MAYTPYAGTELPNLVNVTKRTDPDGSIAKIAELLEQSNPIMADIPLIEGNLTTGHRTTARSDTPTPTWRRLNYGVMPTKSTTTQVDDTIGMLEDYGEVDKKLAQLNGNSAEFRMSEDKPHLDGMSNTMASTLFYGDIGTHPDRFLGLAPRYDTLTLSGKPVATVGSTLLPNVVNYGGTTGALTSIWYVAWGEDTVHGIFPKGSNGGLHAEDLGEVTLQDNAGGRFQGYRSHYEWNMGLSVRDWRAISRVVNIELADLGSDVAATQRKIYKAMILAMHAVPAQYRNRGVFYCGAAVSAMLDLAAVEKTNLALGYTDVFGEPVLTFRRRPIRECHAILETETAVA